MLEFMKLRVLLLAITITFSSTLSARADSYFEWRGSGSSAQFPRFSSVTQPIVVSSTDIRKVNYLTLPLCQSLKEINLAEIDCVKSIEATTNGKDWVDGRFDSYIRVRQVVKDSPSNFTVEWARSEIDLMPGELTNNSAGSRSSIWTFPGIIHKNGNQFLISYTLTNPTYNDKINYEESYTEIRVAPIVESLAGTPEGPNENPRLADYGNGKRCFVSAKATYCLNFFSFDNTNLRFRFTVRLGNTSESMNSGTWMYTQSFASSLKQNRVPGSPTAQDLVFELSPTAVQIPRIVLDSDSLITSYVDAVLPNSLYQGPEVSEIRRNAFNETKKQMLASYLKGLYDGEDSFAAGSTFLMGRQDKFISPKNTTEFIGLRVQTLRLGNVAAGVELYQTLKNCPSTLGVAGVISSNATAVEPLPPTLDKVTQTLKYRVAAPHLKQNGELNTGFYRLQLNPHIAKCIWGDNLLGAKAEVSILNDSGEIQVATSTFIFNETAAVFEISGFHYSAGTVNIKLIAPVTSNSGSPQVTDLPKTTPAAKSKITITCTKSKLTKKVTAINPKCPAGFKKK